MKSVKSVNVNNFPAEETVKRKLASMDPKAHEDGYDSDGNLPYWFDYNCDDSDNEFEEGGGRRGGGGGPCL